MFFEEQTINDFLDELSSDSPAPGGGSVAALCGALGAALVSMVSNLTIGREKFKENWAVMDEVRGGSELLISEFARLMNEDAESFKAFMTAMNLPKDTDDQKASRKTAMALASKNATEVPLHTLECCAKMAALALKAVRFGNPNTASDAGSAALLAAAAGRAAAYNVRINLSGIKDLDFTAQAKKRMSNALVSIEKLSRDTEKKMNEILG
jgi:glutamate formiminotransferase/formiminotetrahydrofolate cyclodeaminase